MVDIFCAGCDIPGELNENGLCADCAAKLERDLIRNRDWDYSVSAFAVPEDQLETLRELVIREYGAHYELIEPSEASTKKKRKNKRSNSRNTKRKREIATKAIRAYTTDDVLKAAQDFIRQRDEVWVNFSHVSQHLYETFYKLKPRQLGKSGRRHKSLLKFLVDYPELFEIKPDDQKTGLYWMRLAVNNT
jgi:hypothetical protein